MNLHQNRSHLHTEPSCWICDEVQRLLKKAEPPELSEVQKLLADRCFLHGFSPSADCAACTCLEMLGTDAKVQE